MNPSIRIRGGLLVALLLTAGAAAGEENAPAARQARIKGLLVVQLADGTVAGTASQMNATVVRGTPGSFRLGFNQDVGEMMEAATREVEKFLRVRHPNDLPLGHRVELAFSDKYSPKDGPSAAVVSALLAEAIITGDGIDPGFAATGDMTAAGDIRPVGGIVGKIRGAVKKKCAVIGIPAANTSAVNDLYIMEGIAPLCAIQIFGCEDFDQARALAMTGRGDDLKTALEEFALVQKAIRRDERFVTNAKVREKLRNIVKLAPNHLSARLLFLHGSGSPPRNLSLPGSLLAIDRAAAAFSMMMEDGSYLETGTDDVLFGLVSELKRLRPMLDPRTADYAGAHEELAAYIKSIRGRRQVTTQIGRELQVRLRKVHSERKKLLSDSEVMEELMLE
jgi:hypothetical protein